MPSTETDLQHMLTARLAESLSGSMSAEALAFAAGGLGF